MNDYVQYLKDDLPQEFKKRPYIDALINALGRQLDELKLAMDDMGVNRFITTADGQQLDVIGNILVLSRDDAKKLINTTADIDDETYRQLLVYKAQLNFGDGTYKSIMNCLKVLYEDSNEYKYVEELQHPATLILQTEKSPFEGSVQKMLTAPIPRAGGVGLLIRATESDELHIGAGIASILNFRIEEKTDTVDVSQYTVIVDKQGRIIVDKNYNILIDDESYNLTTENGTRLVDENLNPLVT